MTGRCYFDRIDFWEYVARMPEPRVIVLEDVDPLPGSGALVGEIHANIALALHCVGYVTNGAVRSLPAVEALGFQLFSERVVVSHAYAHIVEFGDPVTIGGLKICPGELIHGDRHGVQTIPLAIAPGIPEMAAEIDRQEKELISFCQSEQFSLAGLATMMGGMVSHCATNVYHPGSHLENPIRKKR